jgi:CheY-like chemotaxis protein
VKTILVVDDDPGIRDVLALLLEDAGYAVHAVPNALAALAAIARDAPDLVTTDLSMPGVNGVGLIRRLRCERPNLPISDHADERIQGSR